MLASQDLRRRHERRLATCFHRSRHGEKSDECLPGTDIALQEAKHATRRGHIGCDFGERTGLRRCRLEGEVAEDRAGEPAIAVGRAPRRAAKMGAHQRQGELGSEKLVIGEAPARRRAPIDIGRLARTVQEAQGIVEGRVSFTLSERRILPFRKLRHALDGMADEAPQKPRMQTFREGVDRLHARHRIRTIGGHDMGRMNDLAHAVIVLEHARDDDPRSHGEAFLHRFSDALEEDERHIASLVLAQDLVGRARTVGRRRPMRRDGDLDGRELADARRRKLRARAPVEREARQMEQEIDDPGLFLRSHGEKPSQESSDLVADPGKPRDGSE